MTIVKPTQVATLWMISRFLPSPTTHFRPASDSLSRKSYVSSVCFSLIAGWFVSVTFCDSLRIRGKLYYERYVHTLFLFHFSPGLLSSLRPKFISSFALTTPIHFGLAVLLEMVSSGSVTSFRGRVGSVCMLMWDLRSVWREEPGIWSQTPCNHFSSCSLGCLSVEWVECQHLPRS